MTKIRPNSETKTQMREVCVDISSLLFISRALLTAKLRVLLSRQQCILRTMWLHQTRYLV